jgi:hypothetical protein
MKKGNRGEVAQHHSAKVQKCESGKGINKNKAPEGSSLSGA